MKIKSSIEKYKSLGKFAKWETLLLGVSVTLNCLLILLLSILIPLKEFRHNLVQFSDQSQQVIRVLPIHDESEGMELHKESIVREYVVKRETIDLHTDGDRWASLHLLHDEEIETIFSDLVRADNTKSPLHQFKEQNMVRKVTIISSKSLAPIAPNVYEVEWLAQDCSTLREDNYRIMESQIFISTVSIELQEKIKKVADRLENPFGVTVINYTISKKHNARS